MPIFSSEYMFVLVCHWTPIQPISMRLKDIYTKEDPPDGRAKNGKQNRKGISMETISIEIDDRHVIEYGVLAIFSVNEEDEYIAVVPLTDDGKVADADVQIFGYEESEDEDDFDVYEISDPEEYQIASRSFNDILKSLSR